MLYVRSINNGVLLDFVFVKFELRWTDSLNVLLIGLIDEFENFERNYYSGAMGIIDSEGNYTLSVIIRSIFYNIKTKRQKVNYFF